MPLPRAKILVLFLLICPRLLQAQDSESSSSLLEMLQQGGWAMYPLGLCSLVTLFLVFHGYKETKQARYYRNENIDSLKAKINSTQSLSNEDQNTVLSRVYTLAIDKFGQRELDADMEKMESSIGDELGAEEQVVDQWIHYLQVVANVSPMIGLLGTVSGMIGAFNVMSSQGMGRPELFAGSIGEALITTATGLCVGIPAMIAYFVLRNRLSNRILETARIADDLNELLLVRERKIRSEKSIS